jgi:hypothetical protein
MVRKTCDVRAVASSYRATDEAVANNKSAPWLLGRVDIRYCRSEGSHRIWGWLGSRRAGIPRCLTPGTYVKAFC